MNSPFNWSLTEPGTLDPLHFRYFFRDIARKHLPCDHAEILSDDPEAMSVELGEAGLKAMTLAIEKGKPVVDSHPARLFLPLRTGEELFGIAIVEGGDPAIYAKYTTRELLDRGRAITADLQALQGRVIDPLTGLFNSVAWREYLVNCLKRREDFVLVMLEVYPRARDAGHGHAYLQRAAGALDSIVGHGIPLFHFGSGLFGMLWHESGPGEVRDLADVVLYRLQRDGLDRAQMGQVWVKGESPVDFEVLMDRAWQAVVKARRRGPFAKAAFLSEEELIGHPLRPLSPAELNRFRDIWHEVGQFSIAALKCDSDEEDLAELIEPHLEEGKRLVKREGGALFLFLPGGDRDSVLKYLKDLQVKVEKASGRTFSAGLASFPFGDSKRSAVPLNARKALQHTFFFGPNTVTAFDAVSLNISGDVYYNEGDMNGAVREYLAGLELDPKNVNLLNSLGVAYVRLDRLKAAIDCFEKALTVEENNFMALFNLGSAWLTKRRDDLAVGYLERALAVDDGIFDLVLQLAELYCRSERYEKVVELLDVEEAERESRADWEDASALRCLGEAWRNLGENRRAIECLQQANSFNPRDSRVLSMLGELYDLEDQGEDVAFSLCRAAVELDDSRWDNWQRLGFVQYRHGFRQEALASLLKSLRINRSNLAGALLLEKIYRESGKERLANRMAEKVEKIGQKA